MKRTLIILDGLLLSLIVILGIALFFSVQNQRDERSITTTQRTSSQSSERALRIIADELVEGKFDSLAGLWKNEHLEANSAQEVVITGPLLTRDGASDELVFREKNSDIGLIRLGLKEKEEVIIAIYPRGSAIPVRTAQGEVDYTGESDPTDMEQDRLIVGQGYLNAQQTEQKVFYRQMEETI